MRTGNNKLAEKAKQKASDNKRKVVASFSTLWSPSVHLTTWVGLLDVGGRTATGTSGHTLSVKLSSCPAQIQISGEALRHLNRFFILIKLQARVPAQDPPVLRPNPFYLDRGLHVMSSS
ncbi:hypothetical protein PHISCL_10502 [Aspergillus sclerotialis]|uniref:Uncharacterized protein n=1 Tax=Aspergillus sclerotialis TaxID=2070753 RepID=A0A3A2ZIY3_9EURO|nr:hypothetical protein PHISCL_10502 [Aspergillus sclerotialis]